MIVVDTTVWVDFFRCTQTLEDRHLQQLILDGRPVFLPGVIYCEILQGIRDDAHYARVQKILLQYPVLGMTNLEAFEQRALIYRTCPGSG